MRVPGIIYASDKLMKAMGKDESPKQVANVAQLPGIVTHSLAMPDMHWGYGFPIGGVAAFDINGGIVSPGGVGYDINCGCRLMMTNLRREEVRPQMARIVNALFQHVPSGVGSKGALKLSRSEEKRVLVEGARWAVKNGYGSQGDLESMEDGGCLPGADPEAVSERALERGKDQVGTLGSGNHFLEVEIVEEIFDRDVASALGIEVGQVAVMIHSGSRGFGHQVCDDYLAKLVKHVDKIGINLPDRQLACAYIQSTEGQQYLSAMACAANYAWANRQMLMHWTGEALERALGKGPRELGMRLVYDVCHNIAKIEEHVVEGKKMTLCVHRKGATRAFPPGHPALPQKFRKTGQPVLIPGDMGTGSYVLVGTGKAMEKTFGSTCHGAGRVLSRAAAIKASRGRSIRREMEDRGVLVMSAAKGTLAEEIPEAYKNIDEVVNVVHGAGLSRKVAKLRAVGCIKG
jgi:tRNA-splicing ligase RtcB